MHPLIQVAFHTLAVYLFLIILVRLYGRRAMGQLTAIDLAIIIVLGSAVETAMVAGNTSLAAGLVSACTLLVANRLLATLFRRSRRLRHIVATNPLLLVHNGELIEQHMRQTGLTEADVLEALRERECVDLADVRYAVLEADGTVTVLAHRGGCTETESTV